MAFKESPPFPDRIAFGAVGGPAFNTSVLTVSSGEEARNQNWSESRQEYDVSSGVKTEADYKAIDAFFRSVRGKAIGFRFKDWLDFSVAIDEGIVAGLTTTTFQLQKQYESGSDVSPRVIKKPIAAGFVLKDSGTTLTLVTHYTLDTTTGIVTTTAPRTAADLTWSGEFDVPVRFDVDKLQGQILSKNPSDGFLVSWDSIPLLELKNP
jgi:uncharacterized protein (TIGR02217 family)